MIKNVVFDMGNVLVTWEPEAYAAQASPDPGGASLLIKELFQGPEWVQLDLGILSEDEAIRRVCARLPVYMREAAKTLFERWHEGMRPVSGMAELLRELGERGCGRYLLSNFGVRFHKVRHAVPELERFDGLVISAEVGQVKPGADIFRTLLDRYALTPQECLFVDDMAENVETARNLGMEGFVFGGDSAALRVRLCDMGILREKRRTGRGKAAGGSGAFLLHR